MGKGDKKSKKGKRFKGSFGNARPQKIKKDVTIGAIKTTTSKKVATKKIKTVKAQG